MAGAASLFLVPSEAGRLFLWALEAAGAEFWGPQTKMSLKRKKHATAIVLVCATLLYSCCANRDYITLTAGTWEYRSPSRWWHTRHCSVRQATIDETIEQPKAPPPRRTPSNQTV